MMIKYATGEPESYTETISDLNLYHDKGRQVETALTRSNSKLITELKSEANDKWVKWRQLEFLLDAVVEVRISIHGYETMRKRNQEESPKYNLERAIINRRLQELYQQYKKLDMRIRLNMYGGSFKDEITPEKIAQARDYPIGRLVEARGGVALCPFHDDKNPSMSIKGNFYYCFACGANGDVISFIMRRDGLNFIDAVKFLT